MKSGGGVYTKNVIDCGFDFEAAADLTFQQLVEQIEEKDYLTWNYFEEKFKIAWEDFTGEMWWVDHSLEEESFFLRKGNWLGQIFDVMQCFWVLICFLVFMDALYFLKDPDEYHLVICLILFGFALLLAISEVQGRYKCVVYPYMAVLAAQGLEKLIGCIKRYIVFGMKHMD